ncbi:MAG: SWIM zinc finger family protein, partial [Polyangiaceae bacterium]|nr:SWIM zinc finger family protein [Polyangiaceae bacterium]
MNRWDNPWPKYVPVAERQRGAKQAIAKLAKKGPAPAPVVITGRAIATTFWGKGWCSHLERFSDYENRLPRGRSYVRSGAVIDLRVGPGRVDARVLGTSLYQASVVIAPLGKAAWREIVRACAGKVDSLVELLQGRFDRAVMQIVGRAAGGLFPEPSQLTLSCSCPDWADLCKHLAAVLYGVGARLDTHPELLFTLRGVDPTELVASAPSTLASSAKGSTSRHLDTDSLADVFGIELEGAAPPKPAQPAPAKKAAATAKASATAKATPAAKASSPAKATPAA